MGTLQSDCNPTNEMVSVTWLNFILFSPSHSETLSCYSLYAKVKSGYY